MVTEHRGCKWQQSHQRPYLRFLNRNEVVQVTREEKGHQKTHRLLGDDDDEVCPAAKDTHREAVTPLQKSACSRGVWVLSAQETKGETAALSHRTDEEELRDRISKSRQLFGEERKKSCSYRTNGWR